MKKQLLNKLSGLVILLMMAQTNFSQSFIWIKGTNLVDQGGFYGIIGAPAITNRPGARETATTWKDAAGNFWLFGGYGFDLIGNQFLLGDLWKYSPLTNQWTWVNGDNIVNEPAVYGTLGVPAAANTPGARQGASSWVDASGNLWLFGGITPFGEVNDLWKYSIATNEWTWVNGNNAPLSPGNYGVIGVSAASNVPGSRSFAATWLDATGNLCLFGGAGNDASSVFGGLNDIWRYNIATNEWVWVKGSASCNQNGLYGTLGIASAANDPGTRYFANIWQDAAGDVWIMGGLGLDAYSNVEDLLNDLWKYNVTTNEWTWLGGSVIDSQAGIYGTLGVSAPTNMPGARFGSAVWLDASGDFYLFGGYGNDYLPMREVLNDLWKYSPTTNEWTWVKGSNIVLQSGMYGTQGQPSAGAIPGARSTAASWTDASGRFWLFGGAGVDATGNLGELNDLWGYTTCAVSPTVAVASSASITCPGATASLTVTGAVNYTWSSNSSASVIVVSPVTTSNYTVVGTDSFGCRDTASFTQLVGVCTGLDEKTRSSAQHMLYPNPNQGAFTVTTENFSSSLQLIIYNMLGQKVASASLDSEAETLHLQLPKGVYYYNVAQDNKVTGNGKLVIE